MLETDRLEGCLEAQGFITTDESPARQALVDVVKPDPIGPSIGPAIEYVVKAEDSSSRKKRSRADMPVGERPKRIVIDLTQD